MQSYESFTVEDMQIVLWRYTEMDNECGEKWKIETNGILIIMDSVCYFES